MKALFLMTVSIGDGVFFVAFSGKRVIYIRIKYVWREIRREVVANSSRIYK